MPSSPLLKKLSKKAKLVLDKLRGLVYYIEVGKREPQTRSSIEVVITGTTGNRVYPKRVPRVQIPPAPPEKRIGILYEYRFFFISTMSFQSRNIDSLQLGHALL